MRSVTLALLFVVTAGAQSVDLLKSLKFREIGPANMGGRIDDFAVVESNTNIVYAATASGGVFKTVNGGISWKPVFDDQPVSSIGDVTVSQSEPDVVWVGTGEANNPQSSSWGNGVYKSADGGKSWTHMGLNETRHIGRIAIHPSNANVVYVAAQGNLWGASEDRGVFKTTDGGKTQAIAGGTTPILERIWDPKVQVRGKIANVWAEYDFHSNGKFTHCGIDTFLLLKTDEGWKIFSLTYTMETQGCKPSPLGEPK